jgi:hypothetical protein
MIRLVSFNPLFDRAASTVATTPPIALPYLRLKGLLILGMLPEVANVPLAPPPFAAIAGTPQGHPACLAPSPARLSAALDSRTRPDRDAGAETSAGFFPTHNVDLVHDKSGQVGLLQFDSGFESSHTDLLWTALSLEVPSEADESSILTPAD